MLSLFKSHIDTLQQKTNELLQKYSYDSLLIFSGRPKYHFLDDYTASFNANPHFLYWMPFLGDPVESWILVSSNKKPVLYLYSPDDFWHVTPEKPEAEWCECFEIVLFSDKDSIPFSEKLTGHVALISEPHFEFAEAETKHNPEDLMAGLHYIRAVKSDWEQACIREANRVAVKGHLAAQQAFNEGETEFQIHQKYLLATEHLDAELPYSNIVGLNEHSAVLHYQHKDKSAPSEHRTLLVDGGASVYGYAADITRTCAQGNALFESLINEMDRAHLALLEKIKPGVSFVDLHIDMHAAIFDIVVKAGIVKDADLLNPANKAQISSTFFPHGLGHLLGLQVHDIGGWQHDEEGFVQPPPNEHPFLRLTRTLEAGYVITVEPGLYFIPSLLDKLKGSELERHINWSLIEQLTPWGGIRIEDNICVTSDGYENFTRDAFALLERN